MSSKHILIVLPNLHGGGAERLHVNLANLWVEHGLRVSFALMQKAGDLAGLLHRDIELIDLGSLQIREVPLALSRCIKRRPPDVTIAAMWPLTTAAVLGWIMGGRKGRLFLSDHTHLSVASLYETNFSLRTIGWLIRLSYPFASGRIAVSGGVKDDLCQLSGLKPASVRVIYNPAAKGIDVDDGLRSDPTSLWERHNGKKILSVGTLKMQKDHETLLRALALLPSSIDAKLVILGEGPLREDMTTLAAALGVSHRLSLPGFVLDPYPWFASADLFVLSSRWEGFGNVIIEAMECGTPVVSTDCPSGPAEILDNGRYGELVPVQDTARLARAIETSLTQKPDRDALKQRAKEFSVESISKQYLDYLFHA